MSSSLTAQTVRSNNVTACLFLISGMGLFVLNDSCVKSVISTKPLFEILTLRSALSCLFLVAILAIRRDLPALKMMANFRLLSRGALDFGASIMFFNAIITMPLANVTAIQQIVPLIMAIYAAFIWREYLPPLRIGAVLLGFLGALLIARSSQPEGSDFLSTLVSGRAPMAFATAFFVAFRDLVARGINHKISPLVVVFGALTVATCFSFSVSLFQGWEVLAPLEIAKLCLAALCYGGAHLCVMMALRLGQIPVIAPFYYAQTGFAYFLAMLFFGELPTWLSTGGTVLVIVAGLVNIALERQSTLRAVLD